MNALLLSHAEALPSLVAFGYGLDRDAQNRFPDRIRSSPML